MGAGGERGYGGIEIVAPSQMVLRDVDVGSSRQDTTESTKHQDAASHPLGTDALDRSEETTN